jgi:thiamine biosynthesis lipoprotein
MKKTSSNLIALTLVLLVFGTCSKEPEPQGPPPLPPERYVTRQLPAMGTIFQVLAYVRTQEQERALDDALLFIADLESRWSPWQESSELNKINKEAGLKPVKVLSDTLALLQRSVAMCFTTDKAFDPTFFALSPLYDFRKDPFEPPSEDAIAEKLKLVGCDGIEIDATASTVRLSRAGMRIHLGGNAKGTALDRAAKILKEAGIERFVVDGGGDIVAQGLGPKGPWRVGVQHPRAPRGTLMGLIESTGGAVATSGDYERFALSDGVRYHHIVDTRTGKPSTGCMSATVTVPASPVAGELADSLATALCVLGPEKGLDLIAKHPGVQAAVLSTDGVLHKSKDFKHDLHFAKPAEPSPNQAEPSE